MNKRGKRGRLRGWTNEQTNNQINDTDGHIHIHSHDDDDDDDEDHRQEDEREWTDE